MYNSVSTQEDEEESSPVIGYVIRAIVYLVFFLIVFNLPLHFRLVPLMITFLILLCVGVVYIFTEEDSILYTIVVTFLFNNIILGIPIPKSERTPKEVTTTTDEEGNTVVTTTQWNNHGEELTTIVVTASDGTETTTQMKSGDVTSIDVTVNKYPPIISKDIVNAWVWTSDEFDIMDGKRAQQGTLTDAYMVVYDKSNTVTIMHEDAIETFENVHLEDGESVTTANGDVYMYGDDINTIIVNSTKSLHRQRSGFTGTDVDLIFQGVKWDTHTYHGIWYFSLSQVGYKDGIFYYWVPNESTALPLFFPKLTIHDIEYTIALGENYIEFFKGKGDAMETKRISTTVTNSSPSIMPVQRTLIPYLAGIYSLSNTNGVGQLIVSTTTIEPISFLFIWTRFGKLIALQTGKDPLVKDFTGESSIDISGASYIYNPNGDYFSSESKTMFRVKQLKARDNESLLLVTAPHDVTDAVIYFDATYKEILFKFSSLPDYFLTYRFQNKNLDYSIGNETEIKSIDDTFVLSFGSSDRVVTFGNMFYSLSELGLGGGVAGTALYTSSTFKQVDALSLTTSYFLYSSQNANAVPYTQYCKPCRCPEDTVPCQQCPVCDNVDRCQCQCVTDLSRCEVCGTCDMS